MAAAKASVVKRKRDRRERRKASRASPPLPRNSRRFGIPREGALPHGEEAARPKDSGRYGA